MEKTEKNSFMLFLFDLYCNCSLLSYYVTISVWKQFGHSQILHQRKRVSLLFDYSLLVSACAVYYVLIHFFLLLQEELGVDTDEAVGKPLKV